MTDWEGRVRRYLDWADEKGEYTYIDHLMGKFDLGEHDAIEQASREGWEPPMSETMSAEEFVASRKKKSKYRNKRVRIGDRTFQSIVEGARYLELRQMEDAGMIRDLKCQPRFPLFSREGDHVTTYVADFSYWEVPDPPHMWMKNITVEDVKGVQTDVFKIKWKWLQSDYHVDARIITRDMVNTRGMDQYVIGEDDE